MAGLGGGTGGQEGPWGAPGCSPSGACGVWASPGLEVDRGLLDLTAPGGGRDAHPAPSAWALTRSPSEPCDGGGHGPETPELLGQPSQLTDQASLSLLLKAGLLEKQRG